MSAGEQIVVTQADRDAATEWLEGVCHKYLPNTQEHKMLSERFARHRIDATRASDARIAGMAEALEVLRDLPIVEKDGPDTLILKGERLTGPVVDWAFRMIRKIKGIADNALATNATTEGEKG